MFSEKGLTGVKMTGETLEVRSDKRKPREKKERNRERKDRKREKRGEKERKRCPGSIIINLHSICKKKIMFIGRNAQNLKKLAPDQ